MNEACSRSKKEKSNFESDAMRKLKRVRRSTSSSNSGNFDHNFTLMHQRSYPVAAKSSAFNGNSSSSYIILNDCHNKFDIDNIVIPYEMVTNSNNKSDLLVNKEILTPKWRITKNKEKNEVEFRSENEDLSDESFLRRHELHEFKERYYTIFKKLEKEKKALLKQQRKDVVKLMPTPTIRSKLEDLCLEEFKSLVNKLEAEHKRKTNGQFNNIQLISNNSSYLNSYLNDIPQKSQINSFDLIQTCKF